MEYRFRAELNGRLLTEGDYDTIYEALREGMKGLDDVDASRIRGIAYACVPKDTMNEQVLKSATKYNVNLLTCLWPGAGTSEVNGLVLLQDTVVRALATHIWNKFKSGRDAISLVGRGSDTLIVHKVMVPLTLSEISDSQKEYLEKGLQKLLVDVLPGSEPKVSLMELEKGHIFSISLD